MAHRPPSGPVTSSGPTPEQRLRAAYHLVLREPSGSLTAVPRHPVQPLSDTHVWPSVAFAVLDMATPDACRCPICLDTPRAARLTRCGHIYCAACILTYFDAAWEGVVDNGSRRSLACPVCGEWIDALESRIILFRNIASALSRGGGPHPFPLLGHIPSVAARQQRQEHQQLTTHCDIQPLVSLAVPSRGSHRSQSAPLLQMLIPRGAVTGSPGDTPALAAFRLVALPLTGDAATTGLPMLSIAPPTAVLLPVHDASPVLSDSPAAPYARCTAATFAHSRRVLEFHIQALEAAAAAADAEAEGAAAAANAVIAAVLHRPAVAGQQQRQPQSQPQQRPQPPNFRLPPPASNGLAIPSPDSGGPGGDGVASGWGDRRATASLVRRMQPPSPPLQPAQAAGAPRQQQPAPPAAAAAAPSLRGMDPLALPSAVGIHVGAGTGVPWSWLAERQLEAVHRNADIAALALRRRELLVAAAATAAAELAVLVRGEDHPPSALRHAGSGAGTGILGGSSGGVGVLVAYQSLCGEAVFLHPACVAMLVAQLQRHESLVSRNSPLGGGAAAALIDEMVGEQVALGATSRVSLPTPLPTDDAATPSTQWDWAQGLPPLLVAPLLQVETGKLTPSLLRTAPYLAHLPLWSPYQSAEVDLTTPGAAWAAQLPSSLLAQQHLCALLPPQPQRAVPQPQGTSSVASASAASATVPAPAASSTVPGLAGRPAPWAGVRAAAPSSTPATGTAPAPLSVGVVAAVTPALTSSTLPPLEDADPDLSSLSGIAAAVARSRGCWHALRVTDAALSAASPTLNSSQSASGGPGPRKAQASGGSQHATTLRDSMLQRAALRRAAIAAAASAPPMTVGAAAGAAGASLHRSGAARDAKSRGEGGGGGHRARMAAHPVTQHASTTIAAVIAGATAAASAAATAATAAAGAASEVRGVISEGERGGGNRSGRGGRRGGAAHLDDGAMGTGGSSGTEGGELRRIAVVQRQPHILSPSSVPPLQQPGDGTLRGRREVVATPATPQNSTVEGGMGNQPSQPTPSPSSLSALSASFSRIIVALPLGAPPVGGGYLEPASSECAGDDSALAGVGDETAATATIAADALARCVSSRMSEFSTEGEEKEVATASGFHLGYGMSLADESDATILPSTPGGHATSLPSTPGGHVVQGGDDSALPAAVTSAATAALSGVSVTAPSAQPPPSPLTTVQPPPPLQPSGSYFLHVPADPPLIGHASGTTAAAAVPTGFSPSNSNSSSPAPLYISSSSLPACDAAGAAITPPASSATSSSSGIKSAAPVGDVGTRRGGGSNGGGTTSSGGGGGGCGGRRGGRGRQRVHDDAPAPLPRAAPAKTRAEYMAEYMGITCLPDDQRWLTADTDATAAAATRAQVTSRLADAAAFPSLGVGAAAAVTTSISRGRDGAGSGGTARALVGASGGMGSSSYSAAGTVRSSYAAGDAAALSTTPPPARGGSGGIGGGWGGTGGGGGWSKITAEMGDFPSLASSHAAPSSSLPLAAGRGAATPAPSAKQSGTTNGSGGMGPARPAVANKGVGGLTMAPPLPPQSQSEEHQQEELARMYAPQQRNALDLGGLVQLQARKAGVKSAAASEGRRRM